MKLILSELDQIGIFILAASGEAEQHQPCEQQAEDLGLGQFHNFLLKQTAALKDVFCRERRRNPGKKQRSLPLISVTYFFLMQLPFLSVNFPQRIMMKSTR